MFTQEFNNFAVIGDSIHCEMDGFDIRATIVFDEDSHVDDAECYSPEHIEAWRANEWFFCGVCVRVAKAGIDLTGIYDNALWGIECNFPDSNNEYLREVANDLLSEAIAQAKAKLAELCAC